MTATMSPATGVAAATPAGVDELALRWQEQGDERAREQLFERFMPLARKLAARYVNPSEPLEDLVQVASVGLLGAVDRYDPRRGIRFSAFAVPTILGELKRHFRDTGWSAHVPRGAQEMALRVDGATRTLTARHGRAPNVEELAQYLEVSVEDVMLGLDAGGAHYSVSLDGPTSSTDEEQPPSLGESLGSGEEGYALVETKLSLAVAIEHLPHLERQALRLRVDEDLKQTEIAERLGCSQMQVSRLLRRAAGRIRELTDPPLAGEEA